MFIDNLIYKYIMHIAQTLKVLLLILVTHLSLVTSAVSQPSNPLPSHLAFQFSVQPGQTANQVIAHWQIAKGYYLYKDQFHVQIISPPQASLGIIHLPPAKTFEDQNLGKLKVYGNELKITIPWSNPGQEAIQLLVQFQGCAQWGFCYPPKRFKVSIPQKMTDQNITITPVTAISPLNNSHLPKALLQSPPLSEQQQATQALASHNIFMAMALFFGFGLLLAFTPCVLPMVPILSGIIVGHGKQLTTSKALGLSIAYVLGMALTFAIAGVIAGLAGSHLQSVMQAPAVLIVFSLFFVAMALSLFGFYDIQLPASWQQRIHHLSQKQQGGTYLGVVIMGVLSTLIVSPCITPPLVGALAYIGNTGNAVFGGTALFFMGLGMGLPLIIIGASLGKLLPKAGQWMNTVKNIFGVIMLGVALWMLERILPEALSLFLWACLLIISAVYMGAFSKTPKEGWGKLCKGAGIIAAVYGIVLMIGAAMGSQHPFQPLQGLSTHSAHNQSTGEPSVPQAMFTPVKTVAEVKHYLAQTKNSMVILDFYADWCISCKDMEVDIFENPKVLAQLKNVTLLRADISHSDLDDELLKAHFNVIAPPTLIFFNNKGQELRQLRVVGEISADEFLQKLNYVTPLSQNK